MSDDIAELKSLLLKQASELEDLKQKAAKADEQAKELAELKKELESQAKEVKELVRKSQSAPPQSSHSPHHSQASNSTLNSIQESSSIASGYALESVSAKSPLTPHHAATSSKSSLLSSQGSSNTVVRDSRATRSSLGRRRTSSVTVNFNVTSAPRLPPTPTPRSGASGATRPS